MRLYTSILLTTTILSLALVSSLAVNYSYAQSIPTGESPFDASYGDVKILDAYFGTADQKIEVEPGDSNVLLTVVLANVGTHDITGIQSQLFLPIGFSGSSTGSIIRADSSSNPLAGEIFYLSFSVNLDKHLVIRDYPASIKVDYSRLRESGSRTAHAEFDFRVTGSSVINAHADQPFLTPLRTNDVSVQITNDGTAQISGVDISTDSPTFQSNLENVVIPISNWNVGQIAPGSSESIDLSVYVPESLKGQTLKIPLLISYYNSYGDTQQVSRVVDFYIKDFVDQAVDNVINARADQPFLTSLKTNNVSIYITNDGTTPISGVDITTAITDLQAQFDTSMMSFNNLENVVIPESNWNVGNIAPGSSESIDLTVYVPESIKDQTLKIPLLISYYNSYGDPHTISRVVDFYIKGFVDLNVFNVNVVDLSAGKLIVGEIINEGNEDGLFGFITVKPRGDSNLKHAEAFIDEIATDSPVPFNVPIVFEGEPQYGEHDITIHVRYKDSIRDETLVSHDATVFIPEPVVEESDDGLIMPDMMMIIIIIIIIIIAVIVGVYVARRKKEKKIEL